MFGKNSKRCLKMIQNDKILIFEGNEELSTSIADKLATRCMLKVFDDTQKQNYIVTENDVHMQAYHSVPYLTMFLRHTRTSAILFRQFLHFIDNCTAQNKDYTLAKLDATLAESDCIIVYVKRNIDNNLNDKYIKFLNSSKCKSLVVDDIDDYTAAIKIEAFVEMHNKIRSYRDSFYKKLISFGRFDGNKILFVAERDVEYLTKLGLEKRVQATNGKEFEDEYREQVKASEITKFIDAILLDAHMNRFETSYTTLVKSDIEKLNQFDIDILKLELKLLKPKHIVSFSKKLTESLYRLSETKSSHIVNMKLPIIYSDEVIKNAANEIRTLT